VGLDGRAALEAIWSVGRYANANENARIPYGFAKVSDGVYENAYALPIGYAMTAALPQADYDALSPLEKQWALLQCAVLDAPIAKAEPKQNCAELPIAEISMENIERDGALLTIGENAVIRLAFDAPPDCELYLEMQGLAIQGGQSDLSNAVFFHTETAQTAVHLLPKDFQMTIDDREAYLVNLGYDDQTRGTVEIRFARPGIYELSELKLYAQPMADYAAMVDQLRQRGLQDVSIKTNAVSGISRIDEPSVMVFSIPYSRGWSAEVDGQSVRTQASAGALLAIELPAGEHEIQLTYSTPWQRTGLALSALSAAILAIHFVRRRRAAAKGAHAC
jgi:uncharacterized membrane protein YfhO